MIRTLFFTAALFVCNILTAQNQVTGDWNASLIIADTIHLVLHISQSNGLYSATLDSPDQGAYGIKCDNITVTNTQPPTINFSIRKNNLNYTGKLTDDSTINGTLTQGVSLALVFHKNISAVARQQILRPQTPKPPFPYKVEEVVYKNAEQTLQYGGTLTIPNGDGKFPAVLLITGSGQEDRDETIFGHKPFAVIADALTKDGFVVLRVDDRGIGNSTGNFATSTTGDFVKDVNTSIDYLKSRKEVDDDKVGLLGHSEGGLIAPIIASQRKDIDFIILLAGPGVKIIDLMAEQNAAVFQSLGMNATTANSYKNLFADMMNAIISAASQQEAKQKVATLINNWAASSSDTSALKMLHLNNADARDKMAIAIVTQINTPWYKYFIQVDPTSYLTDLKKVKVLALNGSKDIQVVAAQNLPAIKADLQKGRTRNFEVNEIPGLNHLFQTCTKCTVQEYGQLQETFSPVALQTITDWLNKNVK